MRWLDEKARPELLQLSLFSILFLFFLQLLTEFVASIYAFGLLETRLTLEIISVLFLLSPLALTAFRKPPAGAFLLFLAEMIVLCRLATPLIPTRATMVVSGLGVASFLMLLPGVLAARPHGSADEFPRVLSLGLLISLAFSIFFRVLGDGLDASLSAPWQIIAWAQAAVAVFLIPRAAARWAEGKENQRPEPDTRSELASFWRLALYCVGVMSILGSLYFAFMAPNVVARWTATSFQGVVILLILAISLFALGLVPGRPPLRGLRRIHLLAWTLVLGLSLSATVGGHQIRFPADPSAYPLVGAQTPIALRLSLVLTLILSNVLFVALDLFLGAILRRSPSPRRIGAALALGSLFLLLLVFMHIFTSVYAYIPIIGPLFRDRFWLVHLLLIGGILFPIFALENTDLRPALANGPEPIRITPLAIILVAAVLAVPLLVIRGAEPPVATPIPSRLRVLTYNIQQGYDAFGQLNFKGQLDLMRHLGPDVIGLQESDTNRISGGNRDGVRYFANQLDMHSYYGPKTVNGTFGIALLSRFPILEPETFYMYSEGEQTAAIKAKIDLGAEQVEILVTHLGNEGPMIQQEQVLQRIDTTEALILMGDFNFRPGSPQYARTARTLLDAWRLRWPRGMDDTGYQPDDRIDHIFVARGLEVADIRFRLEPESDHPALYADLRW